MINRAQAYGDALAETEPERIFAWRAQCLYDAGVRDIHSAKLIALSDCDIHRACDMISKGCSPKLAAKILT